MLGIGKRELLEDYYPDELAAVVEAYAALRGAKTQADEPAEPMSPAAFLAM